MLCFNIAVFAQSEKGSNISIDEVVLPDVFLQKQQVAAKVVVLNDSIIEKSKKSLTELLQFNSNIYFKENGYGMVSSPSFRGTTAQQTSVLWNGIPINSRFLGQTDFNAVAISAVNNIAIKPGGGSIFQGSGAIGGSIHLNNKLSFESGVNNKLSLAYGSYNTMNMLYSFKTSADNFTSEIIINRNSSDNDFKVNTLSEMTRNTNGQFYNQALGLNLGYKINNRNKLFFFSQYYDDERHFSLTSPNETRTKYQNRDGKALLQYENRYKRLTSLVKFAMLYERYRYFNDIRKTNFLSQGSINTYIGKYEGIFKINSKMQLNSVLNYEYNLAKGEGSGITRHTRAVASNAWQFNHQLTSKWDYEFGVRKEVSSATTSPLLFSLATTIKPLSFYSCRLSASKNYRVPTFNDLFWGDSGNPNLRTEQSLQFETTQAFQFSNIKFGVTGYYYNMTDMIRWVPTSQGPWRPINTDNVNVYGGEVFVNSNYKFDKHTLQVNGNYAYTVSQDKKTKKQLFYVPYHKVNGNINYSLGKYSAFVQGVMIGKVFTTSDNNPLQVIKGYGLMNAGVNVTLDKKERFVLGIISNNVTNVKYENRSFRPMPMRNYLATVGIKI